MCVCVCVCVCVCSRARACVCQEGEVVQRCGVNKDECDKYTCRVVRCVGMQRVYMSRLGTYHTPHPPPGTCGAAAFAKTMDTGPKEQLRQLLQDALAAKETKDTEFSTGAGDGETVDVSFLLENAQR